MDTRQALEQLAPYLPVGAPWLPILWWILGGLLVGVVATSVGIWIAGGPLRRLDAEVHWTERARAGYPALVVSATSALLLPLFCGISIAGLSNPFSGVPTGLLGLGVAIAVYLGGLVARRPTLRRLVDLRETLWQRARGELVGFVLLAPQFFVMAAMVACVGPDLGPSDVAAAVLGAAAFAASCHSSGLPLLRGLGFARPADAVLEGIVRDAAEGAGVRVRRVWVVPWPPANAVALPWSRDLVYTPRLLEVLDRDEIAAITAHELGHLSEPVSVKLVRTAGAFALFPVGLGQPIVFRFGLIGLVAAVLASYAILLIATNVARRMELRADEMAHAHESDDGVYASALEKIYRANGSPAVMPNKRPTHPHLYDRLTEAGVVPAYPRPAAPSRARGVVGMLLTLACAVSIGLVLIVAPRQSVLADQDASWRRVLVVLSGDAERVSEAAYARVYEGEVQEAIAWFQLAHALDADDHHSGAYAAELLAMQGDCESARRLLDEASARIDRSPENDCAWLADAREALAACASPDAEGS